MFYTFAGGLKSVVWADCVQFAIYIIGAVLAGIVLLRLLPGGWEQLIAFGQEHGKFRIFDFSLDPGEKYTFAAGLVGGMFLTLATHGTDQLMVQRYLAARSLRDASKALALSGFLVCAQFALFLFLGVGLACFYHSFPPERPLLGDEVFARFLIDHMPVGILGITLAAVFSAAMSSSLNSAAAAAVNDIYAPLSGEKSPRHLLWASRVFTVAFGLVQIGVGVAGAALARSVIDSVLAIASFTAGVVLGMFFLGVLTKRVSETAALVGLLAGLSLITYIAFGTKVAWPWYALIGSVTTFAVGLAASLLWPSDAARSPADRG
jgi:Na+/proline symporter